MYIDNKKDIDTENITVRNLFTADDLNGILRTLWFEHVVWTRLFIISAISNLKDIDEVTARLLKNPSDFAALFELFYGNDVAAEFEGLLRQHLLIAADLVQSAKANDTEKVTEYEKQWYANADQLVTFLSKLNPYIGFGDFKKTFYNHLALTKAEVLYRLNGQYPEDVKNFDAIENQAIMMADIMTNAIANQFYLNK